MKTTNIFHQEQFVRSEGLVTLEQFIRMGRLNPGQRICLANFDENDAPIDVTSFWIGDATKFQAMSSTGHEVTWNINDPTIAKFVVEVHTYKEADRT